MLKNRLTLVIVTAMALAGAAAQARAGEISDTLNLAFQKVGELVATYGQQTVNLAAQVVQVDAYGKLLWAGLWGFLWLLSGLAVVVAMCKIGTGKRFDAIVVKGFELLTPEQKTQLGMSRDTETEWMMRRYGGEDRTETWIMVLFFGAIVFGLFTLFLLVEVSDIWTWVALSNPKLALAHQIFEKVF